MKGNADTMNLLAMMADAEARHTANLVEMIAATALFKLKPPTGEEVAEITISQADLEEMATKHHYEARYDEHGAMTLFLTPINR